MEEHSPVPLPTALQKAFTSTLNELGADLALIALKEDGFGPFVSHAHRGFAPREIQAVARTLSHPEVGFDSAAGNGDARQRTVRIRMTAPSHRARLTLTLQVSERVCRALLTGHKGIATCSRAPQTRLEACRGMVRRGRWDGAVIRMR